MGDASGQDRGHGEAQGAGEERVGNEGQKGTKVKGSKDDPRYVVESDKSGKQAAHRPEALDRR